MTEHLTDDHLDAYADGTLNQEAWNDAVQHLGSCSRCRAQAFALGTLLRATQALPRESDPSPWVRDAVIASTISRVAESPTRRSRWPKSLLMAVAAVLLIAVSFAAGRRFAPSGVAAGGKPENRAMAVQQSGTAYVSALASLREVQDTTRGPEILQGREAGLATLYAATAEFKRLIPEDPDADVLFQAAAAARRRSLNDGRPNAVRF